MPSRRVLDHDVGRRDHLLQDRDALGLLQIERERALVAVQVLEVEPVPRKRLIRIVTRLHLDDRRAHVRELADGRGPGARPREVDDRDAVEG
jgi:hypothetical protein